MPKDEVGTGTFLQLHSTRSQQLPAVQSAALHRGCSFCQLQKRFTLSCSTLFRAEKQAREASANFGGKAIITKNYAFSIINNSWSILKMYKYDLSKNLTFILRQFSK